MVRGVTSELSLQSPEPSLLVHGGPCHGPASRHDRRACQATPPGTQYSQRSTADPRASRNCPPPRRESATLRLKQPWTGPSWPLALRANFHHAGLPRADPFSAAGACSSARSFASPVSSLDPGIASRTRCMSPRHTLLKRHILSVSGLPVIQTSLRSANTTSFLTGKRPWRHQHHVCPLLCASVDPSRWAHGRFSARTLDVRWAEACCAGTRPCQRGWGAINKLEPVVVPFQNSHASHPDAGRRAPRPAFLPPPLRVYMA